MKTRARWMLGWITALGAFAAACGAAKDPQLVASYPLPVSGGASSGPVVVETVYLTLDVNDPDGAAETAARWANDCGGYEAGRYAWQAANGRSVSQEIFVPLGLSDALHTRLLRMGWKESESVDRRSDTRYDPADNWAQFSIQYRTARHEIDWDRTHGEDFLRSVCNFFEGAAALLVRLAASLLLAVSIVIPCVLLIVGGVTVIRWLFRR